MMDFFRVSFRLIGAPSLRQVAGAVLAQMVSEIGFEAFEETPQGIDGYIPVPLFQREELDRVLQALPVGGVTVAYDIVLMPQQDWNAAWEAAGFDPIAVGDTILIYDARQGCPTRTYPIMIAIEARMAFGTGTHATTQMVLAHLLTLPLTGRRVVDCGCGTGILSIAASKLGAQAVVAYDIDPWSVANTQHNAALNGVTNLSVHEGDVAVLQRVGGTFDLLLANINRNILLADLPHYRDVLAPQGTIILSGFYSADCTPLRERAAALGLTVSAQHTSGDWALLALQ